jgi:hypothetical protein
VVTLSISCKGVQQCRGELIGLVREVPEPAVASADVLEAATSAAVTISLLEAGHDRRSQMRRILLSDMVSGSIDTLRPHDWGELQEAKRP